MFFILLVNVWQASWKSLLVYPLSWRPPLGILLISFLKAVITSSCVMINSVTLLSFGFRVFHRPKTVIAVPLLINSVFVGQMGSSSSSDFFTCNFENVSLTMKFFIASILNMLLYCSGTELTKKWSKTSEINNTLFWSLKCICDVIGILVYCSPPWSASVQLKEVWFKMLQFYLSITFYLFSAVIDDSVNVILGFLNNFPCPVIAL